MKILIYALFQDSYGMGHIHRSQHLYSYFLTKNKKTTFLTNISTNKITNNEYFDLIIFDCANYDEQQIKMLKNQCNKLILLDYFYTNKNIDMTINLFQREKVHNPKYKMYCGLKYSIIKSDILKYRKKKLKSTYKKNILITIGAEDKNKYIFKLISIIKRYNLNIKLIIISRHLKEIKHKNVEIINFTNKLGYYMNISDLIICNSGTTLLESLYIGKPIIAISQNDNEKRFKKFISKKVPLFDMKDIKQLLTKNDKFNAYIKYKYNKLIDGKGVSRIYKLCVKK